MARRARFAACNRFVLFVACLLAVALVPGSGEPAAGQPAPIEPLAAVRYRPPVDAPVVEGFVPPIHPYGRGNRGLEYATRQGQPVRAAAPGTVIFAGLVGGERFVTVLHADRVRTTYGRLAGARVGAGAPVGAGTVVGTATARFIWTARLGSAYLDPAVLVAASGYPVVRLVPDQEGPSLAADRPRRRPGPRAVPAAAASWALDAPGICPVCSPTGPATAVPSPTPLTLPTPRSRLQVVPGQGVATDGKEGPWPPLSP